jgi:hypothetical protein
VNQPDASSIGRTSREKYQVRVPEKCLCGLWDYVKSLLIEYSLATLDSYRLLIYKIGLRYCSSESQT